MKVTKKARKEAVRALISSVPIGVFFTEDQVIEFNVLTKCNFKTVEHALNFKFPTDPSHLHCDGDCFSWTSAIDAKPEDVYNREKAHKAMREAISLQIAHAKTYLPQFCENCGSSDTDKLHVDHVNPPFHLIADGFIDLHGLPLLARYQCGVQVLKENDYSAKWMEYHDHSAVYQTLCRSCNSSKGGRIK